MEPAVSGGETIATAYPAAHQAYQAMREAVQSEVRTLSGRDLLLIQFSLAMATGSKNAVRAVLTRCLQQGIGADTLREVVQVGLGPLGHSRFLEVASWAETVLGQGPLTCMTCGTPID